MIDILAFPSYYLFIQSPFGDWGHGVLEKLTWEVCVWIVYCAWAVSFLHICFSLSPYCLLFSPIYGRYDVALVTLYGVLGISVNRFLYMAKRKGYTKTRHPAIE